MKLLVAVWFRALIGRSVTYLEEVLGRAAFPESSEGIRTTNLLERLSEGGRRSFHQRANVAANALSFIPRQAETIVCRTIPVIPPDKREEWIIRQARQRPPAERGAFLDGACAGDAALRERLERVLAAQDQPEAVRGAGLDAATVEATTKLDPADAPEEAEGLIHAVPLSNKS